MTTSQRSFVQKLNRRTAADVRREVSSNRFSSADLPRNISGTSLNSLSSVPIMDLVEPPEFEDVVRQVRAGAERNPLSLMREFPLDDVQVEIVRRKMRTVSPIINENDIQDPLVRDVIKQYTSDFTVVNRRYLKSSCQHWELSSMREGLLRCIPQNEYETDIVEPNTSGKVSDRMSTAMPGGETSNFVHSIHDLKNSQSDPLLPRLLDRVPSEQVDRNNELERQANRQDALYLLLPQQPEEEMIERRQTAVLPAEHFGHQMLLKVLQLKLELEIEPIFASLALYDIRERKKVSETFHFDLNAPYIKKLLSGHVPREDVSTLSKSCIFSVTYPTSDIFLVVKLEKVLQQGDISEIADPYMKESKDDKMREKARDTAWACCERLGRYRMPFAWAAVNLQTALFGQVLGEQRDAEKEHGRADSLDRRLGALAGQFDSFRKKARDDSSLPGGMTGDRRGMADKRSSWSCDEVAAMMDSFKPASVTLSPFYKQESDRLRDEDLYKFLQDMKRPSSLLKKLKTIPGTLKLEMMPCPEILPYCLSPELAPLDPYPDKVGLPVKELVEFPQHDVHKPFTHYRNLLYVYPRSLNFNNRQGTARNIAVKVQFMASEDLLGAQLAIFGKSSGPELLTEAYSTVTYHSKTPDFYDEIKIKLPPVLHNGHHLLFTFYQVSCQKKAESQQQPVEVPLGYTWVPLLRDGRLAVGPLSLPVACDHPGQNYSMLPPDVQLTSTLANVKWVDNRKPVFDVTVQAVTTVHTLDSKIDHFLSMAHAALEQKVPPRIGETNFEGELKRCISDIEKADGGALVHFLPLVLDKLLQLMVHSVVIGGQVVTLGQTVFEVIASVVRRVMDVVGEQNDRHGRNAILTAYIDYLCHVPHLGTTPASTPTGPLPVGAYPHPTLTRPASVPGNRPLHLSSSDPDLPGSCPQSPDDAALPSFAAFDRASNVRRTSGIASPASGSLQKPIHEELAYQWVVSNGSARDLSLNNAWFFFELIIKTMTQHLGSQRKLATSRRARFTKQFADDITELVTRIMKDIAEQYLMASALTRGLNTSLAFFTRDLISLMDRGYVFKLIHHYFKTMAKRIASDNASASFLSALQLDFLRVICSHEHLVTLNLPLAPVPVAPSSPSGSMSSSTSAMSTTSMLAEQGVFIDLTPEHRTRHFLIGLAMALLSSALETKEQNSPHPSRAVNLVHGLLASIDLDPRYQDRDVRAQVALLFMPIMGIVLNSLGQLFDPRTDDVTPLFAPDIPLEEDERERSPPPAMTSSGGYGSLTRRFNSGDNNDGRTFVMPSRVRLSPEATRNLLACLLWLLKNVERRVLHTWLSGLSFQRMCQLLEAIYLIIANYEYKGRVVLQQQNVPHKFRRSVDTRSRLEEAILGTANARSEMVARRQMSPAAVTTVTSSPGGDAAARLRWRKDRSQWKKLGDSDRSSMSEVEAQLDGCMATEAVLITVDVMELMVQIVQSSDTMQGVLDLVLRVILFALSLNESATALRHLFASQRSIVAKFPELLFEEATELCADLCLRLLHHCSSPISAIRLQASGSLYLLMRQNFEIGNNFARVKMQVTMSLSQLVGQSLNFGEHNLRRSLKTILSYAETDVELRDTSFPAQVQDLVFNLHMILSDTVKMKEYQEDPEMLVDLMYRIAKGYQNSPDLRLTWLQNMAAKHTERGNHAEAAHCLVHAAGLVAEYLNMLEDKTYMPIGCVALQHVSVNVLEESAVSDDVLSPDEEGICTGKYFSESGLVGLLEQAASSFTMASMFEGVNSVFKVLIPIYEANRDFKRLHILHSKLTEAFQNIIKQEGKRVFGTYFRVGFYGDKFGILNGHEYIYKEPAITKLPEISHRLESFYTDKFGMGVVFMIKDSNTVEREKMDATKAYIQITYVEPYFDLYELQHRVTFFEKNYSVKRFMYATPFTQSGRAHGDLREQYKRKTILTTTHFFPYVKTRLEVIQRDQVILSPIEVAIEDIHKKTKELGVALSQEPPDVKILQMVLQGCIGTTVNQGPVEIALVFLKPVIDGAEVPSHHHNKLRISFKNFLKKCRDALERNRTLITQDQHEYQRELQRNYDRVQQNLAPLISTQLGQMVPTGNKKKHRKDRDNSDVLKVGLGVTSDSSSA